MAAANALRVDNLKTVSLKSTTFVVLSIFQLWRLSESGLSVEVGKFFDFNKPTYYGR